MALTATSKAQLNALLNLLNDPLRNQEINEQLLRQTKSGTDGSALAQIITSDGYGSANPRTAGKAAVVTLLADIAAN